MRKPRRTPLISCLLAMMVALTIAGCGGGGSDEPAEEPTTAAAPQEQETTGAAESPEEDAGDGESIVGAWTPTDLEGFTEGDVPMADTYVEFQTGGAWAGTDGCNEIAGVWTDLPDGGFMSNGSPVTFEPCDAVPHVELLQAADDYELTGGELVFTGKGEHLATYVPRS